jgi:taurine dioxygenase
VLDGFDASAPVSADVANALRDALDAHQLLVIRAPGLTAEAHVSLMEIWGEPLEENADERPGQRYGFVSHVRDDGILGDAAYAFHADHAFMPDPIDVLSLYAADAPEPAVATRFANAQLAAAQLPEALRERSSGRRARHIIDPAGDPAEHRVEAPELSADCPHAVHPVLWPHPRTGRDVLFVNAQQTDRIEGLASAESRALLDELFAHLYRADHLYAHRWRPGDLVVWDNRALQHARDPLDPDVPRTLRRVSVGGTPVWKYFAERPGPMMGERVSG